MIFASEYKALLAIDAVPARPNRDAIQVIQSTKWVRPGATCLEGIYPVSPGTWVAIEPDKLTTGPILEPSHSGTAPGRDRTRRFLADLVP